jgi:glycyl-tRNA synthetase beta chain
MKRDLLVEIGCENLPSGYIDGALRQLEELFSGGLTSLRLGFDDLAVTGTPNRLVVHVGGLQVKQEETKETVTGPPVKVGVAPDGSYTKAATGFAERQGVAAGKLTRVETPRGEYLAVVVRIAGREARTVLREQIPAWIGALRFPKVMKWDSSELRFARPVRWVLALLGDRPLDLRLGELRSAPRTRLSPFTTETVAVKGIRQYYDLLNRSRIVLDRRGREELIRSQAHEAARRAGGSLVEDDELCHMVANLVESPVVMTGSFDRSFLSLPREVIVTALKSHQRYFSVEGKNGRLLPRFIAFADGARRNKPQILRGYERVLQARLADARFYYREDTAAPLERMAGRLDGIVWLEGLGTLADKARRVGALGGWIAAQYRPGDERLAGDVERAALLAKADLASEMVKDGKEFTLLQGYIGREYARVSGEREEVAEAIFEHYLPRFSGDSLPRSTAGAVIALADRIDTICGCYIQGLEPTGSQDPYALRRGALGVLRILLDGEVPLDLSEAVSRSLGLFDISAGRSKREAEELEAGIRDLFAQRLTTMLRGDGYDYDIVSAILSAPWRFPGGVTAMVRRLQEMRGAGSLQGFVLAMKRVVNILPKEFRRPTAAGEGDEALEALASGTGAAFDPSLFAEEAERLLHAAAGDAARELLGLEATGMARAVDLLEGMTGAVNRYFDDVLVNCEDTALRTNRHAFLLSLSRMVGRFCHFPEIVADQGEQ